MSTVFTPRSPLFPETPGARKLLRRWFPNLFALPLLADLRADLNGALAGALASIPQTLAYGLIIGAAMGGVHSGVGVLAALYGSVVVGLVAVLFGGCPLLVAGPRAATVLIFAALVVQLKQMPALAATPEPALAALTLACLAGLGAGLLQVLFGALRLGRLANYVPLPVVAGFVNGSALLIILSQVWAATGVAPQESVLALFSHLDAVRPATLLLTVATAALVLYLPKWIKRGPMTLAAVFVSTAVYHLLAAMGWGQSLGGTLPALPDHFGPSPIAGAALDLLTGPQRHGVLHLLLPAMVSMAILSTLDTLLATSATDGLTQRRSNGGRQLMAEGWGNMLAASLSLAPSSGSLARTQAALKGGMVSAAGPLLIVLITLLVTMAVPPAVGLLPQAVMAGLLIALGVELVDKWTLARLRALFAAGRGSALARGDLFTVTVVVATTLIADLVTAVGVGVLVALVSFVMQMAHSPIRRCYRASALIPRIHGDMQRRVFIERHGRAIAIVEMEGALFFGSAAALETRIDELVGEGVRHVVLDLKRVKDIDATGARALERVHATLRGCGGMLAIAYINRERRLRVSGFAGTDQRGHAVERTIWRKLTYLGTVRSIGEPHFLADTDTAVALCEPHLAATLPTGEASSAHAAIRPPILQALDRGMLRQLRGFLTLQSYQPNTAVFAQDSPANGAYFVAAGCVDVVINLPGTERKFKVQSLTAGSVFGEMALFDPKPRSASIVAQQRTHCYHLSDEAFRRLQREHSEIALALLSNVALIFAERLRATNTMLAEMEV
ncbi:MAG: SulP family inorganic anion transporter [Pseudomonadota bacterium]